MKEVREKYPPDKLKIIGISYDSDSTAFVKAMKEEQLNWTQVFDEDRDMEGLFGRGAIPRWILINPDGTIILDKVGLT